MLAGLATEAAGDESLCLCPPSGSFIIATVPLLLNNSHSILLAVKQAFKTYLVYFCFVLPVRHYCKNYLKKIKWSSNSLQNENCLSLPLFLFAIAAGKIIKNLTITCKVIIERDLCSVCFTNVLNHNIYCTDERREAEQINRRVRLLRYNLGYSFLEFKAKYSQFVDIAF